jgi:DNA topoisomerase-1
MRLKSIPLDSCAAEELARLAQLRYVSDEEAGYSRRCNGHGFYFVGVRGTRLGDAPTVKRLQSLAIPPAWTDVWICRHADGHLQATGRDDRHRKQYIYHERWREISNLAKFVRLGDWASFLPELRRAVARDLRGRKLNRKRVLAGMVALLDLTSIRIGNEEYVRQNNSYGLATLRTRHVTISGRQAHLRFRAKGGIRREQTIDDPRLVRLLKELTQLKGAHVFQCIEENGEIHCADALAVNDYLRERTGRNVTAKDFRTWKASALAAGRLFQNRDADILRERRKLIKSTIAEVAETLGNTATVCRKYYIHAGLLETFESGEFAKYFQRFTLRPNSNVSRDEVILARFLRQWEPWASNSNCVQRGH